MPPKRQLLSSTHHPTTILTTFHHNHGLSFRPAQLPHHRPHESPTQPIQPQTQRRFIRSILNPPPKPSRFNQQHPPLKSSPQFALSRRLAADVLPLRPGALAYKKGMTSLYDAASAVRVPVTVLQLDGNQVIYHKTRRQHGYDAVQIGCGTRGKGSVTKPMLGHFSAQGVPIKRHVVEFRVRDRRGLATAPVGEVLDAARFKVGQFVDARAVSKGKGFQGVMKRWGMHGQDRTHGASLSHRSLGSAGQGQGGGSRVYPGKKMAGNMGAEWRTQACLKVMQVDGENGIVVVKGAVSGPKGGLVQLRDAIKKPWPDMSIVEEVGATSTDLPNEQKVVA